MATAVGDLVIRLNALTRPAEMGLRRVRGATRLTTGAVNALSAAFTRILGPIAGVYGLFRLASAGERFNRSMRESLAIMGDVTAEMRERMRVTAIATAKEVNFGADEAAKGYYYLASAGLNAAQSVAALPQTGRFARAGMFDLARAAELAGGSVAAMGLKGSTTADYLKSYNRVTDVLVKANTLANATVEQFAEALGNDAANAGRMAGQSVEQVVAVLAALADKMVKGEQAGTAYARAINYLSIQAVENEEAFRRAGVRMFDARDKTRTLVDVIADLEKRFAGMSDRQRTVELQSLGFTKRTIALMNTLIGTSDQIRRFTRELEQAGGTAAEVAAKQLTPFQRGWARLRATLTDIGSRLMTFIGPHVERALIGLANGLDAVRKSVVGLAPVFEIISKLACTAWDLIVKGFRAAWQYVMSLLAPFQENFRRVFKALVDNLDVMLGSWEGFRQGVIYISEQTAYAFQEIWEHIKHSWKVTQTWMVAYAQLWWEGFRIWLESDWGESIKKTFGSSMGYCLESLKANMPPMIAALAGLAEFAHDKWDTIAGVAAEPAADLGERISRATKGAIKEMAKAIGDVEAELERRMAAPLAREMWRHREAMGDIDEKAAASTKRWQDQMAKLPKLSDSFRQAWAEIVGADEVPAFAAMPKAPTAPGMAERAAKAQGAQFAGAFERGSREAWSAILKATDWRRGPQERIAKHTGDTARNTRHMANDVAEIKWINDRILDAQEEGMDIPAT